MMTKLLIFYQVYLNLTNKNDKKNIDKNILRHSKYIDEKLKETNLGIKKKNN